MRRERALRKRLARRAATAVPAVLKGSVVLAAGLLMVGCASTKTQEQAVVCPQCRMVRIEHEPVLGDPGEFLAWGGEEVRHDCPGCRGALVTLFTDGKLKHQCTVCEQGGFSCPVSHL